MPASPMLAGNGAGCGSDLIVAAVGAAAPVSGAEGGTVGRGPPRPGRRIRSQAKRTRAEVSAGRAASSVERAPGRQPHPSGGITPSREGWLSSHASRCSWHMERGAQCMRVGGGQNVRESCRVWLKNAGEVARRCLCLSEGRWTDRRERGGNGRERPPARGWRGGAGSTRRPPREGEACTRTAASVPPPRARPLASTGSVQCRCFACHGGACDTRRNGEMLMERAERAHREQGVERGA